MTSAAGRPAVTLPTVGDVRGGLRRMLGDTFDDVWEVVCAQAGVRTDAQDLAPEPFEALLTALSEQDQLCRMLVLSWRIRRTAALELLNPAVDGRPR
jgi:hypothetical protein